MIPMKRKLIYRLCALLLLAACAASCQKDEKEDRQRKSLEDYITRTLHAPIDEQDGVYFVLVDTSAITPPVWVERGDRVEFIYLAWSLGGAVFATNDDALAEVHGLVPTPTSEVRVGSGALISGLDRGLQRMALGDHGLILFPFTLGYGAEEHVGLVKPESALIFEVLVTKVNGATY